MPPPVVQAINPVSPKAPLTLSWWLGAAGCALVILGTKLLLITDFGSPTPFWDQWDAEAALLYDPYLNGTLRFAQLFAPHNEHRIFVTRILSLVLLEFAGFWDPMLQMIVNAALHAGFAVMLLYMLRDFVPRRAAIALAGFTAIVLSLPFGWENTLAAFQSQFYLLLIFAGGGLACLIGSPALSRRWWLGTLLALLSYLCLASGALTPLVSLAVGIVQLIVGRRRGPREIAGLGLQALLGLASSMSIPSLPGNEAFKAHSLEEYWNALDWALSWPQEGSLYAPLVTFAPLIILSVRLLRRPPPLSDAAWCCLGLAVWVIVQDVTLAYGRAGTIGASRYQDLICLGPILSFAALLAVLPRGLESLRIVQGLSAAAAAIWVVLMLAGLGDAAAKDLPTSLTIKGAWGRGETLSLRNFLASGDLETLRTQPLHYSPYPDADKLARIASKPMIRGVLPDEDVHDPVLRQEVKHRLLLKGRLRHLAADLHTLAIGSGPEVISAGLAAFLMIAIVGVVRMRR